MASNFTPQQIEEFLQEFFDVVGTRQYIGARYIPIFGRRGETSIEWNNSAPYEPLTIVTYQGNSYTSRSYVPAGVDIANQDYWALSSAYNAQVEAYRQEVIALQNEWTIWKPATEADIAEWETGVVEDLDEWKDDTVTEFETAIGNLPNIIPSSSFDAQNTVKHYIDTSKRSAIYIGNSYTMGTGNNNMGIFYKTRSMFEESHMFAISSTGFMGYDGDLTVTDTFLTCLQNARNTLNAEQRAKITDIMVSSAVGDDRAIRDNWWQNYQNAITQFCEYAETNFPNAIIHVFLCSAAASYGLGDVYPWSINAVDLMLGYFGRNTTAATRFVYHGYCGGRINLISDDFFSADGYHPSDTGYNAICQEIVSRYHGGVYYPSQDFCSYMYTMAFVVPNQIAGWKMLLNFQNVGCGKTNIMLPIVAPQHVVCSTMYSESDTPFKDLRWNSWAYKFIDKPISSGYNFLGTLILNFTDGTNRTCPAYMNIEESSAIDDKMHIVLKFLNLFPTGYVENPNGQTLQSVYPNLASTSWACPFANLDFHSIQNLPAYGS